MSRTIRGELAALWADRVEFYSEEFEELLSPLSRWWEWDRPWWLRWRHQWEWVLWRPFRPDFSRAWRALRNRISGSLVERDLRPIVERYEDSDLEAELRGQRRYSSSIVVRCRIEAGVEELRPLYEELLEEGWEQTDRSDGFSGRGFEMEHPDRFRGFTLRAKPKPGAECEMVQKSVTRTTTEHELKCAGERELVAAAREIESENGGDR